jgi:subtilisin-like proprotein convertase family protein
VCESPGATLLRPFAGTANLYDEGQTLGVSGTGPLSAYNGTPMRGTWTLTVWDEANAPTSTLNSWGLKLRAAKPVAAPGKGAGTFSQTKLVNALVPDEVAAGASTPLISTLVVPKKFKGLQVGDVNLTGFTTTGNITGAAADLRWRIIAPNGRTITIGENSNGDVSIGPLTLDEDVKTGICDSNTLTCSDPYQTLIRPFAGTANTQELGVGGSGNLTALDGVPMRGTWTFLVWDEVSVGEISTLNSWGLKLTAAKPVRG